MILRERSTRYPFSAHNRHRLRFAVTVLARVCLPGNRNQIFVVLSSGYVPSEEYTNGNVLKSETAAQRTLFFVRTGLTKLRFSFSSFKLVKPFMDAIIALLRVFLIFKGQGDLPKNMIFLSFICL